MMGRDTSFRPGASHFCGPFCRPPRRAVLAGALASLAAPRIGKAQTAAPAAIPAAEILALAQRRAVDVHHHLVPPEYKQAAHDELVKSGALNFAPWANWTPQATLEQMEQARVGTTILSLANPGVWFGDVGQGRRLSRICNEYAARLRQDHPGKFGNFAALPLPDTEGTLAEIAYTLDTLHAEGVCLLTSYDDRYLGDASFTPVYEELNRRKAIVYVHPKLAQCCGAINDGLPTNFVELPTDSTRTILSLLYSGSFTKYPDIRWIFSHNGGTLPILLDRVMQLGTSPASARRVPPETIPAILRRHWYESANAANRASFYALMQFADPTHMLFGSDYPYVPVPTNASNLLACGLPPAQVQAILRGNAEALMPGLPA